MAVGREKHHSSRHCAKKKKSNGNSLMIAKSFESNPLNVIFMHHRHKSGADSLCCEGKCILLLLQIISIVRSRLPLFIFHFFMACRERRNKKSPDSIKIYQIGDWPGNCRLGVVVLFSRQSCVGSDS